MIKDIYMLQCFTCDAYYEKHHTNNLTCCNELLSLGNVVKVLAKKVGNNSDVPTLDNPRWINQEITNPQNLGKHPTKYYEHQSTMINTVDVYSVKEETTIKRIDAYSSEGYMKAKVDKVKKVNRVGKHRILTPTSRLADFYQIEEQRSTKVLPKDHLIEPDDDVSGSQLIKETYKGKVIRRIK